jgi:hypothetical protein
MTTARRRITSGSSPCSGRGSLGKSATVADLATVPTHERPSKDGFGGRFCWLISIRHLRARAAPACSRPWAAASTTLYGAGA